jgi:hypothetical protein
VYYEIQLALGAVTFVLALVLVILFFKVYRTQRSLYLLGLPLGFLFIAASHFFLVAHLVYPYVPPYSGSLMWLRVITQTSGFMFIAFSYFFSNRTQRLTKHSISFQSVSLIILVIVFSLFASLVAVDPPGLNYVYSINNIFTIVNLALLSYIILFLLVKRTLTRPSDLLSVSIGFAAIWIGQLFFLLWDILDRDENILLGSQIGRIVGLLVFIYIYYQVSKEAPAIDFGQTE